MSWSSWAAAVLTGIGAPVDDVNFDTLWAWSGAESGPNRMRWNNPLNTTQPEGPGNVDANSVGVKIYPTETQGVRATVLTLRNGYYPLIVSHLRNSVPRQQWGDACAQLGVWGTGCAWITRYYGAAPGVMGDKEVLDPNDPIVKQLIAAVNDVNLGLFYGTGTPNPENAFSKLLDAKIAAVVKANAPPAPTPAPEPAEPKQVTGTFTGTLT